MALSTVVTPISARALRVMWMGVAMPGSRALISSSRNKASAKRASTSPVAMAAINPYPPNIRGTAALVAFRSSSGSLKVASRQASLSTIRASTSVRAKQENG